MDSSDQRVHRELVEQMVLKAQEELVVPKEISARKDKTEYLGHWDPMENGVYQAVGDQRDQWDPWDPWAHTERQGRRDPLDPLDPKEWV
jgi:hypothetical protein